MGRKVSDGEIIDRVVDIAIIAIILAVVVLKICGIITISWLWLLAPLWVPLGLGLVLAIIITILYFIESKIKGE